MRRYLGISDFRNAISALISEKGFQQRLIDEYHIQVLQDYRVAAAFLIPTLSMIELPDANHQKVISQIITQCEAILADDCVYMMTGDDSPVATTLLREAVIIADEAIIHAGNLCNNFVSGILPPKIHEIVLKARDICDTATKRKRYS
jgi:hypothetical protein